MLTNERIRALAALDREALIALMAAAYADGAHDDADAQWASDDADARELLAIARQAAYRSVSRADVAGWNATWGR